MTRRRTRSPWGKAQGLAQFKANTGSLPAAVPTPTINMSVSGRVVSANASYSFSMPTIFMRVLGTRTASFTGAAGSTLTIPAFTNIHIVIDTSSSMGIGATTADQQIVYNATGGCAVACHPPGTTDLARNKGATLRIDVAQVRRRLGLEADHLLGNATRFQVSVWTMSTQFNNVFPLSNKISNAVTTVQALDITDSAKGRRHQHDVQPPDPRQLAEHRRQRPDLGHTPKAS